MQDVARPLILQAHIAVDSARKLLEANWVERDGTAAHIEKSRRAIDWSATASISGAEGLA